MNPVFWLLIILVLIGIWFAMSRYFKSIGETLKDTWEETKEDIMDNDNRKDNSK